VDEPADHHHEQSARTPDRARRRGRRVEHHVTHIFDKLSLRNQRLRIGVRRCRRRRPAAPTTGYPAASHSTAPRGPRNAAPPSRRRSSCTSSPATLAVRHPPSSPSSRGPSSSATPATAAALLSPAAGAVTIWRPDRRRSRHHTDRLLAAPRAAKRSFSGMVPPGTFLVLPNNGPASTPLRQTPPASVLESWRAQGVSAGGVRSDRRVVVALELSRGDSLCRSPGGVGRTDSGVRGGVARIQLARRCHERVLGPAV
jgi:hypothetical protein